jgi:hypothetical protein
MIDPKFTNVREVNRYWSQVVTSLVWGQWQVLDAGLRATSKVLEAAARAPADEAAQPSQRRRRTRAGRGETRGAGAGPAAGDLQGPVPQAD